MAMFTCRISSSEGGRFIANDIVSYTSDTYSTDSMEDRAKDANTCELFEEEE